MKEALEKHLKQKIVIDTRSSWVYLGILESVLQGAVEVSAEMKSGKVLRCKLKSLRGGTGRLLNPWKTKPRRLPKGVSVERGDEGMVLVCKLRKGQTIMLTP